MARRAIRKIDPGVEDLSRWLKSLDDLPRPWDTVAVFGRQGALEVELGSGKGLFLSTAAEAQPETNFLGLEVSYKYAHHAACRLARAGTTNAVMVHGDGLRVFREILPDALLAAVHVYFPDPWWKKRHKKRRVMNPAFLRDVERTLVPGGVLHFWSDVEEYFQSTLELLTAETRLAGPMAVDETTPRHDLDYRTHFERRMRLGGLPVYRAQFQKLIAASTPTSGSRCEA